MPLNIERIYDCLRNFDFTNLFIKEFGWDLPAHSNLISIDDHHVRREIAHLADVSLLEIRASNGEVPDSTTREILYKELSALFPKKLLVFIDNESTQSLWYWIKKDNNRSYERNYLYFKGQPGDIFLSKLDNMVSDLEISDEMSEVAEFVERLKLPVNKRFYQQFEKERFQFSASINGIEEEEDRYRYASVLLNRLMFTYFLEKRGFLDGDANYLEQKLALCSKSLPDLYYSKFLLSFFFKMFAGSTNMEIDRANTLVGNIPHLNHVLSMPHPIEKRYPDIHIPDIAFKNLFFFFSSYSWSLVDIPDGKDNEINPSVSSYLFELYIKQKSFASYYTRGEITDYLCKQTIHKLILSKVNRQVRSDINRGMHFVSIEEMLTKLNAVLCRELLFDILPNISVLDPACGSGTFLLAALRNLSNIYSVVVSKIPSLGDNSLSQWYQEKAAFYPNMTYYIKEKIIMENLFGVDISEDEEATEVTCLQFMLALLTSIQSIDQIRPLPATGFNIHGGNSLLGLLHIKDNQSKYAQDFEAQANLNKLLLDQINDQISKKGGRKVRNKEADNTARNKMILDDIERLKPFHWAHEFERIMNERGGFDIIITDPPWEVLRSSDQSFNFLRYNPEYEYQGVGSSTNLYKLFIERCYKLLRDDGQCGLLVPSGIYSDQGAQKLREMLFDKTKISGLFSFVNYKHILSDLDSRFKFALLTFEKSSSTEIFPATFNRYDVEELAKFPSENSISIPITLIRHLSPDMYSIIEFKNNSDIQIYEKMSQYPLLGQSLADYWNVGLMQEFSMTNHTHLLQTEATSGTIPLYEGKMINQFTSTPSLSRYWINEREGRAILSGHNLDTGQFLNYQDYRLGFRSISANTNNRTMIATILPHNVFAANSITVTRSNLDAEELFFLTAVLNSFVIDFLLRLQISTQILMTHVYQLPIPRLTKNDACFFPIVKRTAQLICTSSNFAPLWERTRLLSWFPHMTVTTFAESTRLRAELDGLIAHLYNITEGELAYIFTTFPLVPDSVKVAAQNAYRDVERGLIK